jgi:long-chain-fatty-acid--[acyl-carrier-protein] ligase
VVAMNDPQSPVKGSIGKVLPTMEYRIIDKDSGKDVAAGQQGMLIVRGPNVFLGYLNYTGNSPFIERDGKLWYGTGDLVTEDENGRLFFNGRLKRFVKIGGEMISLPAIEAALIEQMHISAEDGPVLAVEASAAEDHPEIAVFTTIPLDRAILNQLLKKHGLSGLHNIRRVIPVDEIPLLGSGKTNYLKLKNSLT